MQKGAPAGYYYFNTPPPPPPPPKEKKKQKTKNGANHIEIVVCQCFQFGYFFSSGTELSK